jgi:hypothetical protein
MEPDKATGRNLIRRAAPRKSLIFIYNLQIGGAAWKFREKPHFVGIAEPATCLTFIHTPAPIRAMAAYRITDLAEQIVERLKRLWRLPRFEEYSLRIARWLRATDRLALADRRSATLGQLSLGVPRPWWRRLTC